MPLKAGLTIAAIGALAGGAATAGVSAIAAAKQRNYEQSQAKAAAARQQQETQMQMAQLQRDTQAANMQAEQTRQSIELARQAATNKSKLAPVDGDSPLKGLSSIATSPLGDTSEPTLGRRKLLGN